jgi:hypothetical protein
MPASGLYNRFRHEVPIFFVAICFLLLFILTFVSSTLVLHPTRFQLITFRILLTIDAAWFAMALAPFLSAPSLASGWQVAIPLVQAVVPALVGAVTYAADPLSLVASKSPNISSVSWNNSTQTVVITGSGFGTQSPSTATASLFCCTTSAPIGTPGFPGISLA